MFWRAILSLRCRRRCGGFTWQRGEALTPGSSVLSRKTTSRKCGADTTLLPPTISLCMAHDSRGRTGQCQGGSIPPYSTICCMSVSPDVIRNGLVHTCQELEVSASPHGNRAPREPESRLVQRSRIGPGKRMTIEGAQWGSTPLRSIWYP